ncbi:protein RTF1-like protein [Senna tora]|uniref:Protein RTF1-like protein n=1 Tax=Senna tora TaxID=362788 RepID=A0A834W0U0_9FABA|nr:protein RTF1-like protein [Senna tora]
MADLENMLLEAAGRTRTSSPLRKRHKLPKSRLKREGSYSDGGSESRDQHSDDDHHDNAASKNKKASSRSQSHVPLKKRLDPTKRPTTDDADADAAHHDSTDESDVGSDLYKNEDDKQRLANMTELQREMILSDRAAKKGEKEFKHKMRLKNQLRRSQTPSSSSSAKLRSSARHAERTASKGDVLSELRAKRMKQQNIVDTTTTTTTAQYAKPKPSKTTSTSKDITIPRKSGGGGIRETTPSSSSSERESEDHNGYGLGDDSDDDRNATGSQVPTYDEIKEITIRRSKLGKWLIEPFFEELIVGCFVRIGIGKSDRGPVYRLCIVQSVDGSNPERQYKIENRMTHKRLICVWGSENSAARFQMSVVSDSAASEKEYKEWVREVERTCSQMPSKQEIAGKREAIRKTNSYIYSAATVKQMLEEKKGRPLNIAVEKDRLKNQLEVAKCNEDEKEMKRIYRRLQELEARREARDNDARAKRLAEMNKKNRVENFKNLSELKRSGVNLKAGKGKVGEKATEAALQAAAEAGKLIDREAPVGHGTETNRLHDFELPISLAVLQKYGGAQGLRNGFLARKHKVEAIVGCQVPHSDATRHALTLTISDYKRRRGLL